ncbi:unnamed protein product [Rhizophagus irregularis]|nr:unnamed protein product [Rhizophagus irregularis]
MFQTSLKKYKRKFCFLYLSLILHNCASEGSTCCSRSIWSTCWANNGIALLRGQRAVQELKLNVKTVDQNYIGTKLYDEKEKERSRFRSIETPSCESETDHLKKCAVFTRSTSRMTYTDEMR